MKKLSLLTTAVVLFGLNLACGPQPAPDTRAEDERVIRESEVEWSKVALAKDVDRFVANYAEDASAMAPNEPIATGKQAIRSTIGKMFALPGLALSFQTAKVEVARSGDMAYTHGAYTMTMNDAKGKPMTDKGKYVTVYRKQADGSWKAVADMFNTDLPLAAPPTK